MTAGNYERGDEDFNRAIEISPGYADAYNTGVCLMVPWYYRGAIEDFKPGDRDSAQAMQVLYNRGVNV